MPRNRKTTIRSLALAVLGILALSIRAAAVEPATNAEGLWVSDLNHVSEFQGVALQESGTPSANLSFGIKRDFDQFSIAFDRHGNLWTTAHPANSCFGGIDFDHLGDLWVSAHCVPDALVVEFTPAQLSMGGDLEPSVALGQNAAKTNLVFPGPMRFGPALK